MTRTIGVKNVNLVKRLTKKAIEKRIPPWGSSPDNYSGIEQEVIEELPIELWETWEMADQQIRRIIDDTICNN